MILTLPQPYLVLHIDSILAGLLGQPCSYTVIGLLGAERLETAFQAIQQAQDDWTTRPGNVRLVGRSTPVRSGIVGDVLISPSGQIWRIEGQDLRPLDTLPGPAQLSDTAVQRLNAHTSGWPPAHRGQHSGGWA